MMMQDQELLILIRQGNKQAFIRLVDMYKNKVLNTCYRFLLNKEDAADVSQEVFIEIFQSLPSYRGDARLSTWIYRIAVTKCLDEIKKRNRKKRLGSVGKMLQLDNVVTWLSGDKKADTALEQKENLQEIYTAMNQLPDNQRVAFTLSKIEGYSNGEIAAILQTTTVAVESLLYRARKTLGKQLKKNH